jgi:hypothetical protein
VNKLGPRHHVKFAGGWYAGHSMCPRDTGRRLQAPGDRCAIATNAQSNAGASERESDVRYVGGVMARRQSKYVDR